MHIPPPPSDSPKQAASGGARALLVILVGRVSSRAHGRRESGRGRETESVCMSERARALVEIFVE
jgi:hypothetical protein